MGFTERVNGKCFKCKKTIQGARILSGYLRYPAAVISKFVEGRKQRRTERTATFSFLSLRFPVRESSRVEGRGIGAGLFCGGSRSGGREGGRGREIGGLKTIASVVNFKVALALY